MRNINLIFKRAYKAISQPKKALFIASGLYIDQYNNFSYDFHKNGEEELIEKLGKLKIEIIFDVGANIGDWTLVARKKFPKSAIHCFELCSDTFNVLEKNLSSSNCLINNFGLSDVTGKVKYQFFESCFGSNTMVLSNTFFADFFKSVIREGDVKKGSDYMYEAGIKKIDFLKIDVEGVEHLVLKGFDEHLERKAIRIIQFEYGYGNGDLHFLMKDFYELLAQYGYLIAKVNKGRLNFRNFIYSDNDFKSGPNYLAVHKNDEEALRLLST